MAALQVRLLKHPVVFVGKTDFIRLVTALATGLTNSHGKYPHHHGRMQNNIGIETSIQHFDKLLLPVPAAAIWRA
jgi:hypothetical protein